MSVSVPVDGQVFFLFNMNNLSKIGKIKPFPFLTGKCQKPLHFRYSIGENLNLEHLLVCVLGVVPVCHKFSKKTCPSCVGRTAY